jgi:acetyl esterase/lipase
MAPVRNHVFGRTLVAGLLVAASHMAAPEQKDIAYPRAAANPGYDDVTALPHRLHDRKISYGDHPDQFGLLWLPASGLPTGKPTIVLVHGGCWLNAYDITHTSALATALAGAGYPVWNLEYRRADDNTSAWPTSLEDLQRGMSSMVRLAPLGVSADNVIIVGHSAGGHLALLLAAYWQQGPPRSVSGVSVVGLAAITDIARYVQGDNSCQRATALFMGGTPDVLPDDYAAANPAELRISVPVTLLHGDSDQIVPGEQHERLAGENITRVLEPGAGHFDWVHPGAPAFQTLLQTLTRLHGNH